MKKAVYLSVISVLLAAGLIFIAIERGRPSPLDRTSVVETRVLAMNSQIADIETDLERGLHIAAVRSLLGMMEYLSENGTYVSDFDSAFRDTVLSGSFSGHPINLTQNNTLNDWTGRVELVAANLDLDLSLFLENVTAIQATPWEVEVRLLGEFNLSDRKGIASWQRRLNISTALPVFGLEDPLYSIASRGKFANIIQATNVTQFVVGDDGALLMAHANSSLYIASSLAPSYLMRFEGDLSPSPFGIESLVNIEKLEAAAPEIVQPPASSVDYLQLGDGTQGCLLNQTQALDWLRLDSMHLPVYGATCLSG